MEEFKAYNTSDVFYEKKLDPRSINVLENIKREQERKAELPKVEDDHVCVASLQKYISGLEKEVAELKYDKLFRELNDALAEGGEVLAECDADFETAIVIEKDTTLNLNGKTLTISEDTVGDGVFRVMEGKTLTINGSGCINGVGKNDYNMAIWADGGNVIINGGEFTNVGATTENDPTHFDLIYAKAGAKVEINGGFFRCATPKWTLNKHDGTDSTIIVKGGTFVDYDPSNSETENPVANFVAEGYKVLSETQDNGEVWYTVVAE